MRYFSNTRQRASFLLKLCILLILCQYFIRNFFISNHLSAIASDDHENLEKLYRSVIYNNITLLDLLNTADIFRSKVDLDDTLSKSIEDFISNEITSSSRKHYRNRHHRLLCCTFGEASIAGIEEIRDKLLHSPIDCHWAIYIYKGDMDLASSFQNQLSSMTFNLTKVISFEYNHSRSSMLSKYGILPTKSMFLDITSSPQWAEHLVRKYPYNPKTFSKPMLMTYLIPYLDQYDYTWIFDGDISIKDFDTRRLLRNLDCAFPNPPLVSQPLVYENTQEYHYFNKDSWVNHTNILATQTKFVEIQIPIFNSKFLKWYLLNVVGRTLWSAHTLGGDWGYDGVFCPTATYYAQVLHHAKKSYAVDGYPILTKSDGTRIIPCAIISDGSFVHHYGTKQLDAILGREMRRQINRKMIDIITSTFPSYYRGGHAGGINRNNSIQWDPLHPNTTMLYSSAFIRDCN